MVDILNVEREKLRALARHIDNYLNGEKARVAPEIGFALIVFPFGEDKECDLNYISNTERDCMMDIMRAQLRCFERQRRESRQ